MLDVGRKSGMTDEAEVLRLQVSDGVGGASLVSCVVLLAFLFIVWCSKDLSPLQSKLLHSKAGRQELAT